MTYFKILGCTAVALLFMTIATYSNSLNNSFHFDDTHTIVNNIYLRNISNIPLFFKDGTTFSTRPTNQTYRPIVSTTLAIDYWLGNGLSNTFYFHLSMICIFLLQGILMYFLYLRIFEQVQKNSRQEFVSLLAVGIYILHPANAETINYIISRSDSYSTCLLVLSMVLYIRSALCRRWHLYLFPLAVGMLTKPITAVFPLLLVLYLLLFATEDTSSAEGGKKWTAAVLSALIKVTPAMVFTLLMSLFVKKMNPPAWVPGGGHLYNYLITQPYVILKYFNSFFLPVNLSADTDLTPFTTITDIRFIYGSLFLAGLITLAVFSSKPKHLRPIAFGLYWFLLTLLPTSIFPLAEVMNDHRVFLPYIGLMISVSWSVKLILDYLSMQFTQSILLKTAAVTVMFFVLAGFSYGTYQRNEVWKTEESLWLDVTKKSPNNVRGLMNYGVTLMAKADFAGAEKYFLEAMRLDPGYGILNTNLAILYETIGRLDEAETFFKKAISIQPRSPDVYFCYGRYLKKRGRYSEASKQLEKTLQLSTAHLEARYILMESYLWLGETKKVAVIAEETLRNIPGDKQSIIFLNSVTNDSITKFTQ